MVPSEKGPGKPLGCSRRDWIARHSGEDRAAAYDVDPGPLAWLVDLLDDAGGARLVAGSMGATLVGLGWPEIAAWVDGAAEHDLSPTFRRAVILLSSHHAYEANASAKAEHEAPFEPGKG